MSTHVKDYSLLGPDGEAAVQHGLANATWYASPVPRSVMKELMRREDGRAIRDTLLWFALIALFGGLGIALWGTWWAVPVFAVYGVLYCSASDSRWHECGHRTAFKTVWLNDVVYQIACFMLPREPTPWRWSHARHHTDTIIVGRDPEIAVPRPPKIRNLLLQLFALRSLPKEYGRVLLHCTGRLTDDELTYIPESEWPKVYFVARVWVAIYAVVFATAIATRSLLPLVLIGLPGIYGAWLTLLYGLTQHAGLAENVLDHRLNCRTVYMNPINRFLYLNMNYHVEHHMFPMVPYHALPKLHAVVKDDMPAPYPGIYAAYAEIIPAILRQRREPDWSVPRTLPPTARPFLTAPPTALAAE